MCDETIFRILNSHYPHLKNAFNFTRKGLNRVLSAKAGPCMVQNPYGIYWAAFSTDCPYSGVFRKVSYYFRQDTKNNQPPDDPVNASDIVDKLASCNQLRRNCIRLGSNMPIVELGGEGGGGGGEDGERGGGMDSNSTRTRTPRRVRVANSNSTRTRTPRRARVANSNSTRTRTPRRVRGANNDANEITPARGAGEDEMVTAAADGDAGGMPVRPLFWESPEAAKLFGFNYNSGEDVLIGLRERVKMLANVLQSCEGYKDVVDHCEHCETLKKQHHSWESRRRSTSRIG
jgi:hypothetical protein